MSERGSFCTEYIYCQHCFAVAREVLTGDDKYLCGSILPSWQPGETLPIIAGKIGGMYAGEELHTFAWDLAPRLESRLCHRLRIAVLAEQGERIFTVIPLRSQRAA